VCGISGFLSFSSNYTNDTLERIIKTQTYALSHRGPDAEGFFIDENIALGHRRLSIIDIDNNANQPFVDINNRFIIVFNGEIYNYLSLKQKIQNYPWRTNSDTEVILAAFQKWGTDCLQYLNGMFAFAIWDCFKKELFIARDRLGVKPLYYSLTSNKFIFSSEIRSILLTNEVSKEISNEAIVDILGFQAVKTPRSIISAIKQLSPGHFALYNNQGFTISQYWSIINEKPAFNLNYTETVNRTRSLFTDAVKSRMVADVPVGAFLSGGIDSSAIVAVMAQLSEKPVETYSIIFKEKEFDESRYAKIIANKYKTKHTELLLNPSRLLDELPEYFSKMDSPTTDGINTYVVSKIVAQAGGKVALSGLGGDELFGGYQGFNRFRRFSKFSCLPTQVLFNLIAPLMPNNRQGNKLMDLFKNKRITLSSFYHNSRSIFLRNEIENLGVSLSPNSSWFDLNKNDIKKYPLLSQYGIGELTNYTLDVLLKDTDQMSMASALEIREPFFDYHLIEFLISVPDKFKYQSNVPKSLLVKALGDFLPHEIVYRPKKGFAFPWEKWIRNELFPFCIQNINALSTRDIFDKKTLTNLINDFKNNRNGILWLHIWTLVTIEAYLKENNL
jgi:asparagine synthase (glutamine-hydrolysing)